MAKRDREETKKGMADIFAAPGVDLVGAIVSGDRVRSGRAQPPFAAQASMPADAVDGAAVPQAPPPTADNQTSHIVITQSDIMTNIPADTHANTQASTQPSVSAGGQTQKKNIPAAPVAAARKPAARARPAAAPVPALAAEALAQRIEEARRMAASPTMTVTLRIPQEMNEWLDEYVHSAWREKIKKQDLVIEALQLLIARRGRVGEETLATGLLTEA